MAKILSNTAHRTFFIFVTVLVFILAFKVLLKNPLLLASFASSVFVIFAQPTSHSARPKVLISSHAISACSGYVLCFLVPVFSLAFSNGVSLLLSGGIAVAIASYLMMTFKVKHAPAAATALSFSYAFAGLSSAMNFLIALFMIVCLGIVKSAWHVGIRFFEKVEREVEDMEAEIEREVKKEELNLKKWLNRHKTRARESITRN